jgi:hypothetical protein
MPLSRKERAMSDATEKEITITTSMTPYEIAKGITAALKARGAVYRVNGPMVYIYGHRNGWLVESIRIRKNKKQDTVWYVIPEKLDEVQAWAEERIQSIWDRLSKEA